MFAVAIVIIMVAIILFFASGYFFRLSTKPDFGSLIMFIFGLFFVFIFSGIIHDIAYNWSYGIVATPSQLKTGVAYRVLGKTEINDGKYIYNLQNAADDTSTATFWSVEHDKNVPCELVKLGFNEKKSVLLPVDGQSSILPKIKVEEPMAK